MFKSPCGLQPQPTSRINCFHHSNVIFTGVFVFFPKAMSNIVYEKRPNFKNKWKITSLRKIKNQKITSISHKSLQVFLLSY
jgi:hypothetical protein